jgi:hypothetical protein
LGHIFGRSGTLGTRHLKWNLCGWNKDFLRNWAAGSFEENIQR